MVKDQSTKVAPDLERVLAIFNARTGLSFRPHNLPDVDFRIRRCMARAGKTELAQYAVLIETDQRALDELIVELTVGETYFFRDPKQFEYLRKQIIPELLAHRPADSMIRAWSAGCASGEEAYSLAMLFDQMGLINRCQILGTDISSQSLAKCRAAKYREWSFRNGMAEQAKRYVHKVGDVYEVIDRIRRPVRFGHLNLSFDGPGMEASNPFKMDIILCRNVLIYFDQKTIQSVAEHLFRSLSIGGWLLTASGDPSLDTYAPFRVVVTDWGVFYQRAASIVAEHPRTKTLKPTVGFNGLESVALALDETIRGNLSPTLRNLRSNARLSDSESAIKPNPVRREQNNNHTVKNDRSGQVGKLAEKDPIKLAVAAMAAGDYERAVKLTSSGPSTEAACIVHVKALANLDTVKAERVCEQAAKQHPMSPELQFLRAALLIESERYNEAEVALRRVLFLDRSLAIVHFTLGTVLAQMGDFVRAEKAFFNVQELCRNRPADETVPLTDSERAGHLAAAAEIQLSHLAKLRK